MGLQSQYVTLVVAVKSDHDKQTYQLQSIQLAVNEQMQGYIILNAYESHLKSIWNVKNTKVL